MSCCDVPKLNLADIPCREIPPQWTLDDAVTFKTHSESYQFKPFGSEYMHIIMHVEKRLPRKIKKHIKKLGIKILFK